MQPPDEGMESGENTPVGAQVSKAPRVPRGLLVGLRGQARRDRSHRPTGPAPGR